MEQNPIKYSDLISPDDSIEKLIQQLEALNEAYTGMATSVRQQASSLAAALRSVSGATSSGQQATRNAATDADKLAKAYRDLEFAQTNTAKRIQELRTLKNEENRMTKLQIQLNNATVGSYNQLSAQYSLNKMAINNLTKAERANDPAAKKLIEDTKAIYEEMKRMQEATGKFALNVGNYENSIVNAIGVNTQWYKGLQEIQALFAGGFTNGVKAAGEAVAGLGKKFLALLANPIVLTIAGVAAAFAALAKGISSSEQNTQALQRVLAPFERVLTGVVSVLQTAAEWLLKGVEGMENLAMGASRLMERLPLVGKAFKGVNDAIAENIELTRRKQALDMAERANTVEQARLARDVAKFRQEAEKTSDPMRRATLMKMANAQEEKILYNELKLAKEDLAIQQAKARQAGNNKEANDALAAAQVRLYKAEENYYSRTTRLQSKLRKAQEKMNNSASGGGTGKKDTSAEDAAKKELEERRKIEDARIALIDDAIDRERATIIAGYERQIQDAREKYGEKTELIALLEQERAVKLADLIEKSAKQQEEAQKKAEDARLKAIKEAQQKREQAIRDAEKEINDQYELSMSYANLEDAENKKTEMRLKAEKERLQKLLALYEKDGKVLTEAELQTIRNNIQQVDNELEKNSKRRDVYDILGFSLDDEQKQAVDEAFASAINNLNSYMDAWVQAAEAKLAYAEKEVDSTKKVLDAEIEARAQGYASNVAFAQKEYEEAKKNQQKALKEQQRAQKAQEMIDTAMQVSSLITATANIWKAFSGVGPWGIALAVAATALMFGSFAAAKIKAASVAGSGSGKEEYAEGTVELLQGGSHQSGNDIDLGRKKNGVRRRAEGGEFFAVINKRNSRRYRSVIPDVINSFNDGTFAQKYQRAYDGAGNINVKVDANNPDLTRLSDDVRLIREQGERTRYVDGQGNTIETYKNLRRIIIGN